jgi:hypothetical protein
VEHGVNLSSQPKVNARRPDMSTFFSKLSEIKTDDDRTHNNIHATPTPGDVSATYRLLADGYNQIRNETTNERHRSFLDSLIEDILEEAEDPPKKIGGVPQSFLDGLDRVSKKQLKKTDLCPICGERFLDDPYPLVVELPCHSSHKFDLECIAPWLKLQGSCPLDRKDLTKRKIVIPVDDEEEDYDDQIA